MAHGGAVFGTVFCTVVRMWLAAACLLCMAPALWAQASAQASAQAITRDASNVAPAVPVIDRHYSSVSSGWTILRCNAPHASQAGFDALLAQADTLCTTPTASGQPQQLQPDAASWYRIRHPAGLATHEQLAYFQIRQLHLRSLTSFVQQRDGSWLQELGGADVAASASTLPSLIPVLRIQALPDRATEYFVRVSHDRATAPVLQLSNEYNIGVLARNTSLVSSAILGMFCFLALLLISMIGLYGSRALLVLLGYTLVCTVVMLSFTGQANLLVWPNSPEIAYRARFLAPALLCIGCSVLLFFTGDLLRLRPWLRRAVWAVTGLMLANALVVALQGVTLVQRNLQVGIFVAMVFVIGWAVVVMLLSKETWMVLMAVAYTALMAGSVYYAATILGFLQVQDTPGMWLSVALLAHLYFLTSAFYRKERLVWMLAERAKTNGDFDRVTGLMFAPIALQVRLPRMLERSRTAQHDSALLRVRWVQPIDPQQAVDPMQIGQVIVALAAMLTKVVRGVDMVARADNGDFLILIEGPCSHTGLTRLATTMIAGALRAQRGGLAGYPVAVAGVRVREERDTESMLAVLSNTLDDLAQTPNRRLFIFESQKAAAKAAEPAFAATQKGDTFI